MTAREMAIHLLYQIEVGEAYSNTTLDKELRKSDLSKEDKALASQLVYGVLTWKLTIDEIIKRYSSIRLKKISKWILNILRIAIYQIVWLDRIPTSAAVNESVKLAKKYGHEASVRFTNAILRKIEKEELIKLEQKLKNEKLAENEILSIMTSHPLWLVDELLKQYEKDFVQKLLIANNEVPLITLRVNTLQTTREKLLKDKIIVGEEGNLPDSIFTKKVIDFDSPYYVVQDEAAQLACLQLEVKEGELVLDACSAPGGKTTYLAQLMHNVGHIDAWDIHEHRVKLVEEMAYKLGLEIIHATLQDATIYQEENFEKYDRVLLDVPCSGLGVIRKKPEIKWTRTWEDVLTLMEVQQKILESGAKYLKRGGTLVYSTCTVLKQENEEQIAKFLSQHKEMKLMEEKKLYPHIDGTDGFYIAKLQKN